MFADTQAPETSKFPGQRGNVTAAGRRLSSSPQKTGFPASSPGSCRSPDEAVDAPAGAKTPAAAPSPPPCGTPPPSSRACSRNTPVSSPTSFSVKRCSFTARSFSSNVYLLWREPPWLPRLTDLSTDSFSSMVTLPVSLECHPIRRLSCVYDLVVSTIAGSGTEPLLVRADGPSLTQFGVTGVLAQPILTVLRGQAVVASNTGWGSNPNPSQIASVAAQVGAFPFTMGSADSAVVSSLPPGAYTAQISGADNATGVALAELYEGP